MTLGPPLPTDFFDWGEMMEEDEPLKKPLVNGDGYLYFNLDINPEPWRIGPLSVGRGKGRGTYATIGRDQQLHAYKQAVQEQLREYNTMLMPGLYVARYYFWRRRDAYTTERQVQHRKHEADLTNLTKATEDACQSILFGNDRDCVGIENYMFEQGAEVTPRVLVGVSPVGGREDPIAKLGENLAKQIGLLG